ncbi:MAG: tetratricopeptide repeat protein [Chloroflexi bacterium]|nr:tetratricopeptide repeat protein [Chloroflexota bacterium]
MAGREDIFQKAMNEGHSSAWDQNWAEAASAYMQALVEFPDSPKALNSFALAQYQLQNYPEALKAYIRTARVSPEDPIAFEKIAQINERIGSIKEAIQAALYAAELYLKLRDIEKATENWLTVIQLDPESLQARSRLALIHEKTGQIHQAAIEYIAVASILQHAGNPQKANEILAHAASFDPESAELQQAINLMRIGQVLPKPLRPKGGTGPLRMAAVKELSTPKVLVEESPDPIIEARQKALEVFADVLFDMEDDSSEAVARRGLSVIVKAVGLPQAKQTEHSKILLHLSEAIDAQTKEKDSVALVELERAIESGFNHQAVHFDIGLMLSKTDQQENALRNLQQCVKHQDYALAARLLSGKILRGLDRTKQAALEYLEALKIADVAVVASDQAEIILQLYEPLIESVGRDNDPLAQAKLCDNVEEMLVRVNWRQHLQKMRSEMPNPDGQALPLAEIIIQAQSSQVIEAMKMINELARANYLRSAMDEAFHTLLYAPTYLPLHILIAELLIREGRRPEAITKFSSVANAYSVRGEGAQATNILRRVIQLAPMDLGSRTRLVEQLVERGQVDAAISEYMELADIYYRLAELDMARKAFTTALRLAQQPNANHTWSVKILQRMADIDMQRLDWRQAIRVYEQIRTLVPDDFSTRESLIELNLRLAQIPQAQTELEAFIAFLERNQRDQIIPFMQKLLVEHPDQIMLHQLLADQLHKNGQTAAAITLLDQIGEKLMQAGNKSALLPVLNQILLMNPPNAEQYRALLAQL